MFKYVKKMEYPVNIRNKDLKMAKNLLAQYGGPYTKRDYHERKSLCIANILKLERKITNVKNVSIDIVH